MAPYRERTFEERLRAAQQGRARQPWFLVVNFEDGYETVTPYVAGSLPPLEYSVPRGGAKFDFPVYACMTELAGTGISAEIYRQQQTVDGFRVGKLFGTPERLVVAAGESPIVAASRAVPNEWFFYPDAPIIRKSESLRMQLVQAGYGGSADGGAGAFPPIVATDITGYRAVFLSELLHGETSEEGKLTDKEIEEISRQISTRRQRTFMEFVDVDFSAAAKYEKLTLPELNEWALVVGFTMGTPTGGANNYLKYSQVRIQNPNGTEWTNDNEAIPILVLAAPLFDASNKQIFSRDLLTPYLVGPRRENLSFTFSQRAALGTDTVGKLGVILRTV